MTRIALSALTRMSGPITRLLGPTKTRLQGYVKQARTLFMVPINESDLDKEETQLQDLVQQISTNIALLQRCNKEWTTLLAELRGEEKVAEEKEYLWAADGDDGLIELLLDSHETVTRLQGRLTQMLRKQEKGARPLPPNAVKTLEQKDKVISQIKLPKLNLPIFDGNILCWKEFWDIFNSSVHEQEVPNMTKLSYLKGALCGAAAAVIGGVSITNDNYGIAIELLKEKFGNREVIIDNLSSQLQHLPIATNRISDIRSTFENIEKILRQLESQREDINSQKILVQQMLSKFPTHVIIKLEESKGLNDPWTVPKLRQPLQRYITIHTNAQWYEVNSKSTHCNVSNRRPDKSDTFRPVRNFTEQTSAEALVTNIDVPNQGKKSREAT